MPQVPAGLRSDAIRHVTDDYGHFALGRDHFQGLPAEFQQVRCTDCAVCAIKCPNGVNAAARLIRAQDLFAQSAAARGQIRVASSSQSLPLLCSYLPGVSGTLCNLPFSPSSLP